MPSERRQLRMPSDKKVSEPSKKELQNAYRDFNLYSSILRHDLGNDLQVIFSATEVVRMMLEEGSELHEFVEVIQNAAQRMVRLLEILGQPEKETEQDIIVLLNRLAAKAMKDHQQLEIHIKADSLTQDLQVVSGRLLPLVFDNLIQNAVQYAGPNPEVVMSVCQDGDFVQIDFVDNGPGIAPDIQLQLFERGTSSGRTALGLNLSRRILDAYGGSIALVDYSEGAAFRILLPLKSVD